MTQKVQQTIMSHLSDVQHESDAKLISHRINFVKFLLGWYTNTTQQHDPEKDYQHFTKKHPNL